MEAIGPEVYVTISLPTLINGWWIKQFYTSKGLRQGDPISFCLFNIDVGGLSSLTDSAINQNLIKGVSIWHNGLNLSHAICRWHHVV